MHKSTIEESFDNQKHLIFDKNKVELFLKDLTNELNLLYLYLNFTTTLSTSINRFSIKMFLEKEK
jgi:hypothetical protein